MFKVLHAQVSLTALRGEPPRRLILVNNKRQRRPRKQFRANDAKQSETLKTPSLKKCGKSKSLDSSELSLTAEKHKRQSRVDLVKPENLTLSVNSSSRCTSTGGEDNSGTSAEEAATSRRDLPVCTTCRQVICLSIKYLFFLGYLYRKRIKPIFFSKSFILKKLILQYFAASGVEKFVEPLCPASLWEHQ